MDQNSNMGGFSPMPNAEGVNGFQTAPAGNAPLPNVNPFGSAAPAPAPSTPNPAMPPVAQNPANPAMNFNPEPKKSKTLIETLVLIGVCLIAAVAIIFAVYFFVQYNDLSKNFESEKSLAVAEAVKETREQDNQAFIDKEKSPYSSFTGPSDYGTISFKYPKTWNMLIENDGKDGGEYSVYFAQKQIYMPSNNDARYALRFKILNQQINNVQQQYDSMAKAGTLSSRVFTVKEDSRLSGMRYDGEIQQNMRGTIVIIKINDKTLFMQMDAEAYRSDFEELLTTLRRNS